MAKPGSLTHMLAELSSLDELGFLLARSARLKYTCLSVSRKYLAIGSNTGGVYIFSRDTLKYLQIVFSDAESSSVVRVSLSPSDQFVALALSTGHVSVIELNIDKRTKPERVRQSHDHVGHSVTALTWDAASSKLFIGDEKGKVSIQPIPSAKSKGLFAGQPDVIAYLESSVYQMEWWKDKLLVSTVTHTHLFDTVKHNFSTIGTKSRDGEFGSCFFVEPSSQLTVIYCARPGSRMWEVDFEGKVLNTHQFKQLLAISPTPVVRSGNDKFDVTSNGTHPAQSVNFFKMLRLGQFLITWSLKGLYVFDPINVKVMVWTQCLEGIKEMVVYKNDIYLFLETMAVHKVTLLPIYQLFTVLSSRGQWLLMSSVLLASDQLGIRPAIVKKVKQDMLQAILSGLTGTGKVEVAEKVRAMMEDVSEGSIESLGGILDDIIDPAEVMGHTYLPSGMVVVSEGVQTKRNPEKFESGMKVLETSGNAGISSIYTKKDMTDFDETKEASNSESDSMIPKESKHREANLVLTEDSKQREANLVMTEDSKHREANLVLTEDSKQREANLALSEESKQREANLVLSEDNKQKAEEIFSDDELLHGRRTDATIKALADSSKPTQKSKTYVLDANDNIQNFPADVRQGHASEDHCANQPSLTSTIICNEESSPRHLHVEGNLFLNECSPTEPLVITEQTCSGDAVSNVSSELSDRGPVLQLDASEGKIDTKNDILISISDKHNASGLHESNDVEAGLAQPSPTVKVTNTQTQYSEVKSKTDLSYSADVGPHSAASSSAIESVLSGSTSINNKAFGSDTFVPSVLELSSGFYISGLENDHTLGQTTSQDTTINAMAAIHILDSHISEKSSLGSLAKGDSDIAQPQKISKKKKKKKSETLARSVSADVRSEKTKKETLRTAVSFEDEPEDTFYPGVDLDMDAVSIATVSSIDEEVDNVDMGELTISTPLISDSADVLSGSRVQSPELSVSPPDRLSMSPPNFEGQLPSRKSSISLSYEDSRSEVIPPLLHRLAAAHGSGSSDDFIIGLKEASMSNNSLTGSGEQILHVGSPKASFVAFKDGLSQKFKTQTKSLIKTFKEKNLLLAKSPSSLMLSGVASQQLERNILSLQPSESGQSQAVTAAFDARGLYLKALDLDKQLKNFNALLRPKVLRQILREWAVQLCTAMQNYHEELQKGAKVITEQKEELPMSGEPLDADFNVMSSVESHLDVEKFENILAEIPNISIDLKGLNVNQKSPPNSLLPSYWVTISHSHDPFQLSDKYMDLFRALTTMCFVCGETGDILRCFKFCHKADYLSLVKALLPESVLVTFDPSCYDRLMSLCLDSKWRQQRERNLNSVRREDESSEASTSHNFLNDGSQNDANTILTLEDSLQAKFDNENHSLEGKDDHENHRLQSKVDTEKFSLESKDGNENLSVVGEVGNENHNLEDKVVTSAHSFSEHFQHSKEFQQDLSLALFTRLFFFILDYQQVKRALESQGSKLFLTWSSLLLGCKEMKVGDIVSSLLGDLQVKSATDYLRSGILPHQSALLGHVYQLFDLVPVRASEFCAELQKSITVVDLVRLCVLHSKPVFNFMLRYVREMMINLTTLHRPAAFQQLCQHRDIRYLLLEALLPEQLLESMVDITKSLASQTITVLPLDWLNILLSMIESNEERDEIVQLCADLGQWTVSIKLMTQAHQWREALQLIVEANDISLLKGKHGTDSYVPQNLEEWKYLLTCFQSKQSVGTAQSSAQAATGSTESISAAYTNVFPTERKEVTRADQNAVQVAMPRGKNSTEHYVSFKSGSSMDDASQDKSITWVSLAYLLLEYVGGGAVIELLTEHFSDTDLANTCLSSEFFYACYLDYSIRMVQSHVTHEMLEKISVYLWGKRPSYVPPSVRHAVIAEKMLMESIDGDEVAVQGLFGQVKAMDRQDLLFENLGSQWGQEIDIYSECLCCNMPLNAVMSLSVQGVALFPCGHAFHKCCLAGSVCPVLHS